MCKSKGNKESFISLIKDLVGKLLGVIKRIDGFKLLATYLN